jgi:NAD(P)H-hydrate epimerase
METAGRGVVAAIAGWWRQVTGAEQPPGRVVVLAGGGNNGGDGCVIARILHLRGVDVRLIVAADGDRLTAETRLFLDAALAAGVSLDHMGAALDATARERLEAALRGASLVVDALHGIGPTEQLRSPLADWVTALATPSRPPVVAVDVPAGVHAQTGEALVPTPVRAALTACMIAPKTGLALGAGREAAGALAVVDIGVHPRRVEAESSALLARIADWRDHALGADELGHKGTHGRLLIVGGAPGTSGAGLLSASAALAAGAGLVSLAVPAVLRPALEGQLPDVMLQDRDSLSAAALVDGARAPAVVDAWVIGPGMGVDKAAALAFAGALRRVVRAGCPAVIDADGLTLLAADEAPSPLPAGLVLTPHPGEAGRMLGWSTADVVADRLGAARALAERFGAVVVLKGARTLVVPPQGRWVLLDAPNAALAKAGSGDVLAGIIGARLAAGQGPAEAALGGVLEHAAAGAALRDARGPRRGTATDLVAALARLDREAA